MPRIALWSLSQDLFIFVFSFICFFAVRLPYWRAILAISASGTPIIINGNSNASALGAFEASRRRDGGKLHSQSAQRLIRSFEWETTSWTKQGDERSRHAGRYWRFVQVLRRPGRRRLQKHNYRRPDTNHWPERSRICEEGF